MTVSKLSRPEMVELGKKLLVRLEVRKAKGPPDAGLDEFIPQFKDVIAALESGVTGKVLADAARKALLRRVELADIDVDTWLRHIESFLRIEANRRDGPHVAAATATYDAAFAGRGISHVDDYIPDENRLCRDTLAVLQSVEHAPTVAAIELPPPWLPKWAAYLDESNAAWAALEKSREEKSGHVEAARDAETDFLDLAQRYRKHIDGRASYKDTAKLAEGKELLQPLTAALAKVRTDEAARATRREQAKVSEQATDPEKDVTQ